MVDQTGHEGHVALGQKETGVGTSVVRVACLTGQKWYEQILMDEKDKSR